MENRKRHLVETMVKVPMRWLMWEVGSEPSFGRGRLWKARHRRVSGLRKVYSPSVNFQRR